MSDEDQPLTESQQALMAYVDDELPAEQRAAFERMLLADPGLAAEVAGFKTLADVTSALALAEPTDHEMRRFWESFYNRSEWQLGWCLLIVGLGILLAFGIYELLICGLHWLCKAGAMSALVGAGILFWNTLRLKMRTTRFDRYRGVMR